jgi:hypothetical protein
MVVAPMPNPSGKVPTIIALTNIIAALEAGSGLSDLDPVSRAIVKFVGQQNFEGGEVGASEILAGLSSAASPVTLLGRIGALHDGGWLEKTPSSLHHRRKAITLTDKARAEISRLSSSLDAALQSLVAQA